MPKRFTAESAIAAALEAARIQECRDLLLPEWLDWAEAYTPGGAVPRGLLRRLTCRYGGYGFMLVMQARACHAALASPHEGGRYIHAEAICAIAAAAGLAGNVVWDAADRAALPTPPRRPK